MGLFGFVGKILKGAVGVAANLATGNVVGAVKAGIGTAGSLLSHKQPMGSTATKINVLGKFGPRMAIPIMRGNATQGMGGPMTAAQIRATPILPGGAIATPRGPMPKTGTAPAHYGSGSSSGGRKRKRRSSGSRKRGRGRSSSRSRRGGRKLRFGSPAWRKKYMKRGRR